MMQMDLGYVATNGETLFRQFRWGTTTYCPYCGSTHIYRGSGRYKCADCKRRFTDTTGTLFHSSKLSLSTLFLGAYLMLTNRGLSSYILAQQLGVTQKTAWGLQTKIRYTLLQYGLEGDEMMVDEAYVGGSVKNMHRKKKLQLMDKYNIKKEFNLSNMLTIARRHTKPVLGIVDNKGKLLLQYCPDGFADGRMSEYLFDVMPYAKHITTDDSSLYNFIYHKKHTIVNHSHHIYTVDGRTTNPTENAFSWLKGSIDHNHRHISRKYVQGYLNEFTFRRNHKDLSDRISEAFILFRSTTVKLSEIMS